MKKYFILLTFVLILVSAFVIIIFKNNQNEDATAGTTI